MITAEKFYGGAKEVSLSSNYTIKWRAARVWSFTPTAGGYEVKLPSPVGLKLGGIYFIIINHDATYSFDIVDHDDEVVVTLGPEEASILSLSGAEFVLAPTFALASPPSSTPLVGKMITFPAFYGGTGQPTVAAYWNHKEMDLWEPEHSKTLKYVLFGGTGDATGCDMFEAFTGTVWTAKADIPYDHSTSWCFCPNIHYAIVACGAGYVDYIYKFRLSENTWTSEGDTPVGHLGGAAFVISGTGYVLCGSTSRTVDSYWRGTWTRRREHLYYNEYGSAAADDNKGYFTHGRDVPTQLPDNLHFEYDPVTDTMTQKDNLPTPDRHGHGGFMIHDVGVYYIAGGLGGGYCRDETHGWVPSTDTWSAKDDLPGIRAYGGAASAHYPGGGSGQIGHFFCGWNGSLAQDDVYQYSANSPADTWQAVDTAPANKSYPSVGVVGV